MAQSEISAVYDAREGAAPESASCARVHPGRKPSPGRPFAEFLEAAGAKAGEGVSGSLPADDARSREGRPDEEQPRPKLCAMADVQGVDIRIAHPDDVYAFCLGPGETGRQGETGYSPSAGVGPFVASCPKAGNTLIGTPGAPDLGVVPSKLTGSSQPATTGCPRGLAGETFEAHTLVKASTGISSADGATQEGLRPAAGKLDAGGAFRQKVQWDEPRPRVGSTAAARQELPGSREESPAEAKTAPGVPGAGMIPESSGARKSAETVGAEGEPPGSKAVWAGVLQREARRPSERSHEGPGAARASGPGVAPPFTEDAVRATRPSAAVSGEGGGVAATDEGRQARLGDGGLEQLVLKAKLTRSGHKETFEVLLEPPGAGRVQVEIVSRDGMLHIRLKAEDETARYALERDISRLGGRLAAEGLRIARLEVGELREPGGWQDGTARDGSDQRYPTHGWPDANPQSFHPRGRDWGEGRPGSGWDPAPGGGYPVGGSAEVEPASALGSSMFGGALLDARA